MKAFRIFLLVLIIIGIILICTQKLWVPKLVARIIASENSQQQISKASSLVLTPISISTQKINEANFSGTVAAISGESPLAVKMEDYIKTKIDDFRTQANTDVPGIKAEYGANEPAANYEIDVNSKYIKSEKTESLVTEIYTFTGGAHGVSMYKIMTADLSSGKILTLSDIIPQNKQKAFTELVKKKLNNWIPKGSDAPVLFPDDVNALTFDSFANWSLDEQNLIIYFDQGAIGAEYLGPVAFPLPLTEIKDYL